MRLLLTLSDDSFGPLTCSLGRFMNMVEEELPGVYIHSVNLAGDDGDESTDRKASFFGDANAQVDEVCTSLRKNPMLTGGFNAIGFSQGGQFLRAYIERCNDPPVRNLITFGAQHAGMVHGERKGLSGDHHSTWAFLT